MQGLSWSVWRAFTLNALVIAVLIAASLALMEVLSKAKSESVCLERIIERTYPLDRQAIVGFPDANTFRRQVEAIAWVKLAGLDNPATKVRASPCPSDYFGEGHVLQQMRGLSVSRKMNPEKFEVISKVAYRAMLSNHFGSLDRRQYACAREVSFSVDWIRPTWLDSSLVEILPPIGSMRLFGPSSCKVERRNTLPRFK